MRVAIPVQPDKPTNVFCPWRAADIVRAMLPISLPPSLGSFFEDAWRVVVPEIAPSTHVLLPDHRASLTFIGGYPFGPDTILFSGPSRQARVVPMVAGGFYAGVATRPGAARADFDPLQSHSPLALPGLATALDHGDSPLNTQRGEFDLLPASQNGRRHNC